MGGARRVPKSTLDPIAGVLHGQNGPSGSGSRGAGIQHVSEGALGDHHMPVFMSYHNAQTFSYEVIGNLIVFFKSRNIH